MYELIVVEEKSCRREEMYMIELLEVNRKYLNIKKSQYHLI